MAATESLTSGRPDVWALGPLPPPVTGMTLLTERIVQQLRETGPVTFCNWSPRPFSSGLSSRINRFVRTLGCLVRLLRHGRVQNARLYLVCSSKAGLFMTGVLVNAGRWLGYHVWLHHHTYYYIDRYDWRMAWIDRSLGPHGAHVVHCPQMADDFRRIYPTERRFEYLLPSVFLLAVSSPRRSAALPFRVGHMGNLTIPKGLDLVLETVYALEERGRSVQLRLAGPFHTGAAERLVEQSRKERPALIEYVGAVYGQTKAEFLESIDCFLLPSRSESWGIVLNEAMAAGAPVIACRRGCTATLVGDGAGLVVDHQSRYVELAVRKIEEWMDNPDVYCAASSAAVMQANRLNEQGQCQLDQFAERMFAPLEE